MCVDRRAASSWRWSGVRCVGVQARVEQAVDPGEQIAKKVRENVTAALQTPTGLLSINCYFVFFSPAARCSAVSRRTCCSLAVRHCYGPMHCHNPARVRATESGVNLLLYRPEGTQNDCKITCEESFKREVWYLELQQTLQQTVLVRVQVRLPLSQTPDVLQN